MRVIKLQSSSVGVFNEVMICKCSVPCAFIWSKCISCCVLSSLSMDYIAAFLSTNINVILRSIFQTIAVVMCNGMSCFIAPDYDI